MIRPQVVEDFKDRIGELAGRVDHMGTVCYVRDVWPTLTLEERYALERWMEQRAAEEFRAGEEAVESALPPDAPTEVRRGWLAMLYEGYDALLRRLSVGPRK
jgi:hypothetical protein